MLIQIKSKTTSQLKGNVSLRVRVLRWGKVRPFIYDFIRIHSNRQLLYNSQILVVAERVGMWCAKDC